MPIPQLKKTSSLHQSWRNNKKRPTKKLRKTKSSKLLKSTNRKKSHKDFSRLKKKLFLFFIGCFVLGFLALSIFVAWLSRELPDPNKLIEREIAQTTKIYDRTGETVLYEIHGDQQRTLVNINELPEYIKWATIAIEDKNFYNHKGISIWGILRGVVWQKLKGERIQGGSTLTQQFIKNAVLTDERTIKRKVKEWILAYKMEQKFSKDEILQLYFNEIPYGSTSYGIEAASQRYFAKNAKDLTIAEAAILASLPQAPSKYSPYGPNKDILIGRQQTVLGFMAEQGYITEKEAENAKNQELEFKKQAINITAPHFVFYVKELIAEKYGEKLVEQGGLKIITTLDLYKQEIAEEVITELGEKNNEDYEASNAALVSIDPKTGQILTMVGSRDYFNDDIDGQVNITTSLRQPGSSIKPLVYAASFIKGYTPKTVLYDVVTNFSNDDDEPYEPHNYDNKEHGPVTIRKALAGSLNIPAVKALYLADVDNVLELANEIGYTTLKEKNRYGLSLVLGGAEIKLIEHANAFSAFAREGIISPTSVILKIEDKDGEILEEYEENKKAVLDPKVARTINNILSDNNARAYAFGENNYLTLSDRPVAAKTGTTNDYRDAWTVGYTPSLVTGVWVGNNDNSEMKRGAAGGVVAAPIWNSYMKKVLGDTPAEQFKAIEEEITGKPVLDGEVAGIKKIKIDTFSGLLATEDTPEEFIEEKEFVEHHSILHYIKKNDPRGDAPENPSKDPQYNLWESKIQGWSEEEGFASSSPPKEFDNIHKKELLPSLLINSPRDGTKISNGELIVLINTEAPRGVSYVNYYINNLLLAKIDNPPFNLNRNINFLNNGFHSLTIKSCDDVGNCKSQSIDFNILIENRETFVAPTISWQSPSSGLAISNFDFPLKINLNTTNQKNIAEVSIFELNNNNANKLFSISPIDSNIISGVWVTPPLSGTYKLFAEAQTWNGKKLKTNDILLEVNNTLSTSTKTLIE